MDAYGHNVLRALLVHGTAQQIRRVVEGLFLDEGQLLAPRRAPEALFFDGFPMIFHGFSMIFEDFQGFSMVFHHFPMVSRRSRGVARSSRGTATRAWCWTSASRW